MPGCSANTLCLPDGYRQRPQRIWRSGKHHPVRERHWLPPLIEGMASAVGASGLSLIGLADHAGMIARCSELAGRCRFIDHGYVVEEVAALGVDLAIVKVPDFSTYDHPPAGFGGRPQLTVVADILNEVADPRAVLARLAAAGGPMLFLSPERRPGPEEAGPPKTPHVMREWSLPEFTAFLAGEGYSVHEAVSVKRAWVSRRDILVLANPPGAADEPKAPGAIAANLRVATEPPRPAPDAGPAEPTGFDLPRFSLWDSTPGPRPWPVARVAADAVATRIREAVRDGSPLSLIRIGHAEVRLMGFPDFVSPIWASRSLRVCFGDGEIRDHHMALRWEIVEAVRNADILGLPPADAADPHWANAARLMVHLGVDIGAKMICSQNIHLDLLRSGALHAILSEAGNTTFIGCRSLAGQAAKLYPAGRFQEIAVPGEAKFVELSGQPPHFPDVYEAIRRDRAAGLRGLTLVGAGLPGNVYCDWAKRAGGQGIDIGSVMDVWAGQATRSVFTGYIDRFKWG